MPDKTRGEVRSDIAEIRRTSTREMPAYQRRTLLTEEVKKDLKQRGSFFKTSRGLFYFEESENPKLYIIERGSLALSAMIADRYGVNEAERSEYEHIVTSLRHEAYLRGRSVEVHRLAYYDCKSGRLYVSRFNGWVYRLNGRSIREVPNGTDGVFFWDEPSWQPYEIFRGKLRRKLKFGLLKALIFDSTNFSAEGALSIDDQRWLFSVWLRSHFFGSLHPTKPLLLTSGEKGSGKTLGLRKWLRLLFGPVGVVTSLERDKEDGFVAAVCSEPVAVFDNVDEHVGWLADHLAQVATGVSFKRRQLYTTNEQVEFKPQCFVALTSRTPKFIIGRDDVLDRTLVLQAERLTDYEGEHKLLEEIAKHRNSLWTELLRGLNKLLHVTPANEFRTRGTTFRMADFAGFAMAIARAEGAENKATRIFKCLEESRSKVLLQDEPVSICLEKWLTKTANCGREISSGELQKELSAVASAAGISWPYTSGHSLGQRLAHITGNLSEHFRLETVRDTANQLHYRFWPKAKSLNQAESDTAETQAA